MSQDFDHKKSHSVIPPGAILPFVLLASCFMWWAIANNLTDPLVKVFKKTFEQTTFQASMIQFGFYFGYFCMALPGAIIARRFTYKTGVLIGLGFYALGCFLLFPAKLMEQFFMFCFAYYVLACGLGILETNANPYVLVLGSEESATRRLNFAQAFNPIGAVIGALLCRYLIMARLPQDVLGQLSFTTEQTSEVLNIVIFPYLLIAVILVVVWVLILIFRMPKASEHDKSLHFVSTVGRLLRNKNYTFSVFAQFCYVGTQISVWTYTNFYIPEAIGVTQGVALVYHTWALVLFACMRWVFTGLMIFFRGSTLLLAAAILGIVSTLCVIYVGGMVGVMALLCISGFMSLMFPTIFGLGCSNLGEDTKLASSGQIMAIVGGAIITPLQGAMVDKWGVSMSYWLPLLCFAVIGIYAVTGRKHEKESEDLKEQAGRSHMLKYMIYGAAVVIAAIIVFTGNYMSKIHMMQKGKFAYDAQFLEEATDAVILKDGDAAIVVVPEYQGRVMTTTARGDYGTSSGWINYDLVKQGVLPPEKSADVHMYAFGGEERFWMGPEGGQYAIFFAPNTPFDEEHWFTPDPIDNEPWKVAEQSDKALVFTRDLDLQNHSGTKFKVGVKRTVTLLHSTEAEKILGGEVSSALSMVAYQTVNTVTNKGEVEWKKDTGLLSIWLLSMFKPSPTTTVFIPYKKGSEAELGPVVNDDYFGPVPPDRLKTEEGVIYFKADGKERGKIGVAPQRSKGIAGSYYPLAQRMTLLMYTQPKEYIGYVNSMWEEQKEPYKGDALNSYNDGPMKSGEQMGSFYELESSSPALALKPGESGTHTQTIIHIYGDEDNLQEVLSKVAEGIELKKVKEIFLEKAAEETP